MKKETKELLEMLIEVLQKKSDLAQEVVNDKDSKDVISFMKGVSWGFFLAKRTVEIIIEDGEF